MAFLMKKPTALRCCSGIALLLGAFAAAAQNYPVKPVRLITSGVGGAGDVASRLVAHGDPTVPIKAHPNALAMPSDGCSAAKPLPSLMPRV